MTCALDPTHSRRRFLRLLAGASAAAAAAPAFEAHSYDPGQKETATRYRETEHVQTFYRTNGYERGSK